jgi:hypothetical protein
MRKHNKSRLRFFFAVFLCHVNFFLAILGKELNWIIADVLILIGLFAWEILAHYKSNGKAQIICGRNENDEIRVKIWHNGGEKTLVFIFFYIYVQWENKKYVRFCDIKPPPKVSIEHREIIFNIEAEPVPKGMKILGYGIIDANRKLYRVIDEKYQQIPFFLWLRHNINRRLGAANFKKKIMLGTAKPDLKSTEWHSRKI